MSSELKKPVRWGMSFNFLASLYRTISYNARPDQADPRDWMQAEARHERADANGELWLDFISDTGDSGRAQVTIARMLMSDLHDDDGTLLPRGRVVIFGGDCAYSVADEHNLAERLVAPWAMAAAVAVSAGGDHDRRLYAIPGNHDWYDRLDGFNRVFCELAPNTAPTEPRPPSIAGYQRAQSASYFAIAVDDAAGDSLGWSIHGVDAPLGDMDKRQASFFAGEAALPDHAPRPHRIVVTGDPARGLDEDIAWYEAGGFRIGSATPYPLRAAGESGKRLYLAGDVHHYARYAGREPDDLVVHCGLGSATMTPTHLHTMGRWRRRVAEAIGPAANEPPPESNPVERARIASATFFPAAQDSPRYVKWYELLFGFGIPLVGLLFGGLLALGPAGVTQATNGPASVAIGDVLLRRATNTGLVAGALLFAVLWLGFIRRVWRAWGDEHAARKLPLTTRVALVVVGFGAIGAGVLAAVAALATHGRFSDDLRQLGVELLWHLLVLGAIVGFVKFALSGRETKRHGPSKVTLIVLGLVGALLLVGIPLVAVVIARMRGWNVISQWAAGTLGATLLWPLVYAGFMWVCTRLGAFPTIIGSFARSDDLVAFVRIRLRKDRLDGWVFAAEVEDHPLKKPMKARIVDRFSL